MARRCISLNVARKSSDCRVEVRYPPTAASKQAMHERSDLLANVQELVFAHDFDLESVARAKRKDAGKPKRWRFAVGTGCSIEPSFVAHSEALRSRLERGKYGLARLGPGLQLRSGAKTQTQGAQPDRPRAGRGCRPGASAWAFPAFAFRPRRALRCPG